ncbi:cytochrome P450 [Xylariaceae sp. FL1019]|nr:cytochrome P450 [Xylariaceae sp. FL1019]
MDSPRDLILWLVGSLVAVLTTRSIYRLYFHPLSKYPGPPIAAVSDIWYGLGWLSGRWPWIVENALKKYGDVVRIAPNELVFVRPGALSDIYGAHYKNIELFPKTQINNHGSEARGGLIWEWDAMRHREVAKLISPAFSGRALRAKEPALCKHIDSFIEHVIPDGQSEQGVSLPNWLNWLCIDISADMAYNREMNAIKSKTNPPYLDLIYGFNKFMTVTQVSWRFPLFSPLKYLFILSSLSRPHGDIKRHSRARLEERIRQKPGHLDYFEQIVPEDREPPSDPKEMRHLEQVAAQLLVAGYEPPSVWLYSTIYHLLEEADSLRYLVDEIRGSFNSYEEITSDSVLPLSYLTACLKEGLRILPNTASSHGMPCISPGTTVDGHYIPEGVVCQSSTFALARSGKHFIDPLHFRPARWLPLDHPLYDARFARDNLTGYQPFSQGPRACMGKEVAWWEARLFLAKLLWSFDPELVSGQRIDIEKDLRVYGMYIKPEIRVRFIPAK